MKRPGFLLAESDPQRLYRRRHIKEQRSAAAFLVLTGPLQNSEDQTCKVRSVGLLERQWLCESRVRVYLSRMSRRRRHLQCFVFVICQDLVVGFQTVSAKMKGKKIHVIFPKCSRGNSWPILYKNSSCEWLTTVVM